MEIRCARCHAPLECLASSECWCMELPPGLPVPSGQKNEGCYCPTCLVAVMTSAPVNDIQPDTSTDGLSKLTEKPC